MSRPRTYDRDLIRELRDDGLTLDRIAQTLGCGRTTVRRALYERVVESEAANQRRGECPVCGAPTTRARPGGSLYCHAHKHLRHAAVGEDKKQ